MRRRFLLFVLIFLMFPAALMAQEDFVVYVSEDEAFSIEYPEGWIISDLVAERALIVASNSPRLAEEMVGGNVNSVAAGEQAHLIFLVPTDLFAGISEDLSPDAAPQDFIAAVSELVMSSDDGSLTFGEPDVILFDEREIGIIPYSDSEAIVDGYYLAWDNDGVTSIVVVMAHSGELSEFEAIAFDMLASLQVMISAEDLNQ
jgi:hypothetical protein